MSQISISGDDIAKAEAVLNSYDLDELTRHHVIDLKKLVYEGFDPKRVLALALERGVKAGRKGEEVIGTKSHSRSSYEFVIAELNSLAALAILRGSKIKKIMDKSGEEAAKWMKECATIYGIKQHNGREQPKKDEVTLLRLAAIMAHSVVVAVHSAAIEPALTPAFFAKNSISPPRAVCCSVFGSVIPKQGEVGKFKEEDRRLLVKAWCYHQVQFDKLINPDKPSKKDKILTFCNIQLGNNFHPPQRRLRVMTTCKILDMDGSMPSSVVASLTGMAEAWDALSD